MTDHAYAVRISRATDLDQVEDFITALERAGIGNGNDIGRMKKNNRFPAGAVVVLFTAERDRIAACFHDEFGFTAGVDFALLEEFATKDYGDEGAEIVGFESVSWESEDPVTPQKVFDQIRATEGWTLRRAAAPRPGTGASQPKPKPKPKPKPSAKAKPAARNSAAKTSAGKRARSRS